MKEFIQKLRDAANGKFSGHERQKLFVDAADHVEKLSATAASPEVPAAPLTASETEDRFQAYLKAAGIEPDDIYADVDQLREFFFAGADVSANDAEDKTAAGGSTDAG